MTQQTVAVIDYGMGNLHSVASALAKVSPDTRVIVTSSAAEVAAADRVVFPGVGAMRDCMKGIKDAGFDVLLKEQIASGKPILGICVGMQALLNYSEENGGVDCLSIMPGAVKFFGEKHKDAQGHTLKVPHMGWNTVTHNDHPLWKDIPQDSRFYFVHSYYIQSTDASLVAATCDYGVEFHAALTHGNLFAVQFHPEKSHTVGLQLLKNFLAWDGQAA